MRRLFELLAKVSEAREALLMHREAWQPDASQEWRDKDQALAQAVVTAERAYRDAQANLEPEDAQHREVRERIECRTYLAAALRGHAVAGAEAEFNQEAGLPTEGMMPWAALEHRGARREGRIVEERQDVVATADDAVFGQPQMETLRRVFFDGAVEFLGIRTPSVPFGHPNFPVMTGGAEGSAEAEDAAVDAEAVTFAQETVEPTRLTARYLMRVEDMARFPGFEDILRSDLRMVMTQLRDRQVLAGRVNQALHSGQAADGGAAPNLQGVLATLRATASTQAKAADPTAATTIAAGATPAVFTALLRMLYEAVDGQYASAVSGARYLLDIEVYKRLGQVFKAAEVEGSFLDYMAMLGVEVRASSFFPAAMDAANPVAKSRRGVRTARGDDAVAPVWEGINLIRDPYTAAAKGQVAITAFALHGFKFIRTDAWKELAFKMEA